MLNLINDYAKAKKRLMEHKAIGFSDRNIQFLHKDLLEFAKENDIEVELVIRDSDKYPYEANITLFDTKLIALMTEEEAVAAGLLDKKETAEAIAK